mgnify:CR=1 FL=1
MRTPVDLSHASRLVNHGPTVLISTVHEGRRNLMAAAWSMPVEFVPPRVAVVIDKKTLTRKLVDITYAVGSVSGRRRTPLSPCRPAQTAERAACLPALCSDRSG